MHADLPAPGSSLQNGWVMGISAERRHSSLLLRFIPDRHVDLLVERGAARRELAQLVVLRSHQCGAIAESPADALAIEFTGFHQLPSEVRLSERGPADADKGDTSVAHV